MSKKSQIEKKEASKQWRTGAYLRLSKEDERSGTSVSIENQKAIILNFIEENSPQFILVDIYTDDGISGVSTEHRVDFKRLIEDVKSGIINCVITNDTSRFARNVADAEYYVNTVFPTYSTRFIALGNPGVDSFEDPESVDGIQFHFDNYFNEYFVKMTSKKIRKVLEMKTKKGEFIGSQAPFGYVKDPNNKNKLVVDEEAAEVVKKIFSMFVYDKFSLRALALKLNDMGFLPPREYKFQKGRASGNQRAKIPSWHFNTVKVILEDEKYCGHMVQGKRKSISYKVKKNKLQAVEDWVVVRNTHEAIVSEELYQKAQILLKRRSRVTKSGKKTLYSGFLYCESCGYTLNGKFNKKCYRCRFYEVSKKYRPLYITEEALNEQVLFAVKSQIVLITEMDKLKGEILSSDNFIADSKILKSNLANLEKERDKLEIRCHKLYDHYSDGIIDRELYISRSESLKQEFEAVKEKIAKIKIDMRRFKKVQAITNEYVECFKKYETVDEVIRDLLVDLVDGIVVDKENSPCGNRRKQRKYVKVIFKFADEHKALIAFIGENIQQSERVRLVNF